MFDQFDRGLRNFYTAITKVSGQPKQDCVPNGLAVMRPFQGLETNGFAAKFFVRQSRNQGRHLELIERKINVF